MNLNKLQEKIKHSLESNSFNIINVSLNDDRLLMVSSLGQEFGEAATFFVNKKNDSNNILIGANITFDTRILTKPTVDKIQKISAQYGVGCSSVKHNSNNTSIITIQINYEYAQYNEKDFILHVDNFVACIKDLHKNIYKSIKLDGITFLDISMFSDLDDPYLDIYTCIGTRDTKYSGSWEKYNETLQSNKASFEWKCLESCQIFEKTNNISLDLVCDFVIDKLLGKLNIKNRVLN